MKYNPSTRVNTEVTVRPGPGTVRVLQALRKDLPRGSPSAPGTPSQSRIVGSHTGSALWDAPQRLSGDVEVHGEVGVPPSWDQILASGRFRPTETALKGAYLARYGCGRRGGSAHPCAELRCPRCWVNPDALQSKTIQCSRYNHYAPLLCSSGMGHWKGGDARSAANCRKDNSPPDAWVFGEGGGQDVEVWRGTPPLHDDEDGRVVPPAPDFRKLSMGKIAYFFKHTGNGREGSNGTGPETWWVLLFEYTGAGVGHQRLPDATTKHPVLRLRGRGEPAIFAATSIRRHVHLFHACGCRNASGPVRAGEGETEPRWVCGLDQPASASSGGTSDGGGGLTWRHAFRLAERNITGVARCLGEDKYLLNEHHHSLCRDSFV